MARINFIELPAKDLAAARDFYSGVFGWSLTDFGPSYSCTMTGDVDLGLQGDGSDVTAIFIGAAGAPGAFVLVIDDVTLE